MLKQTLGETYTVGRGSELPRDTGVTRSCEA